MDSLCCRKYLSVIVISVFLLGCENGETEESGTLEQVQTFGNGEEGFISGAMDISTDRKNYLYVADRIAATVLQYDLEGNFIRKIGTPGRGPGEFTRNINVGTAGEKIAVSDLRNFRVSFFNSAGMLEYSFTIDHIYMGEFVVSDSQIVMGGRIGGFQSAGLEEENRFNLFDLEGNLQHSFGDFLTYEEEIPAIFHMASLKLYRGLLHVAYGYFPVYQIYGLAGNLLKEYDLEEMIPVEDLSENSESATYQNMDLPEMKGVIGGIDIVDDRVFLSRWNEDLVIFEEFRLTGTVLEYHRSHSYDAAANGSKGPGKFFFHPERNSFYVLEVGLSGGPRVAEYRITEEG